MNLSDLLNEATVCCPLVSNTRNGAIQELLDHAQNLNYISTTTKLYSYIEELENNHSTAAGKGVAYPHNTSTEVKKLTCILGISKVGLNFNSPDGQLSHIILLSLSSKDQPDKHRKFITLFRSMIENSNIRTSMLEADNPTEISSIINNWETQYSLIDDLE